MPFFSRLTDIVTCNLTDLLTNSDDPQATLQEVMNEMEQGLVGAQRSVQTARKSKKNLEQELEDSRKQVADWEATALEQLNAGDENTARTSLYRKKEAADIVAGLEQQVQVAHSTYESLMTTYRALEARLAEAKRKQSELGIEDDKDDDTSLTSTARQIREEEIEDELAAMKNRIQNPSSE